MRIYYWTTSQAKLAKKVLVSVKICYVAIDVGIPYYRGASIHVYQTSKFLAKAGHEVHVISRRYLRQQQEYEMIDGFHVHRIYRGILGPIPFSSYSSEDSYSLKSTVLKILGKATYRFYLSSVYLFYAASYVARVIRDHNLEAVLERETSMGAGMLASMITNRPMVLEINGPEFSTYSVKYAQRIIAYPGLQERLVKMGVTKDKILNLFAPVDSTLFKPDPKLGTRMKQKLGLREAPIVGYVGIFAPWHGIETLLKASKIVIRSVPETRFVMIGPYNQQWFEKARNQGISNSFLFVGPVDHESVPQYINASDVMVAPFNPSKSSVTKDGPYTFIPFKIMEYMSCGKPVISTDVGSIPTIIKDGRTGILVEPGNEFDLAGAILKLLRNPNLADQIGRKARSSISKRFSWENYVDLLMKAFNRT